MQSLQSEIMTALNSKKYAIVSFLDEDNAVEVIPTKWIENDQVAKWPNFSSLKIIGRCIQDRCAPSENWTTVKIKIYGYSNSFKKAKSKAAIAQDTSNIGSDSSEQESKPRKRKAPRKYIPSETEEDMSTTTKRKKIHEIPKTPQITGSLLNMTPVESEVQRASHSSAAESSKTLSSNLTNETAFDEGSIHSPSLTPSREVDIENSQGDISIHSLIKTFSREVDMQNDLGDGPIHLPSTTSSRDVIMQNDLINRLLQSIQKLETEVTVVNKKVDAILSKYVDRDSPTVFQEPPPPGIHLPINKDEDLIDLNNKLLDIHLQETFIRHLYSEGIGTSPNRFVSCITRKLLTRNVAILYSRLGRKGKKCFMDLKQVFKAVIAAALLKFPKASKEKLAEIFGKTLAGASDWEGRRLRPSEVYSSAMMDHSAVLDRTLI